MPLPPVQAPTREVVTKPAFMQAGFVVFGK